MNVAGVALDPNTNMPIVILREDGGKKILPIWVGIFEAQSILFALEKVKLPRPFTHDLLKSVIENLGAKVERIVINAIKDDTYFARINLIINGSKVEIDSRPSDAIALALRTSSPIYVHDPVINVATMPPNPIDDEEVKRFKERLKDFKLEDLGQ
ncbi:MAG: bifunctional nuclease family protein [bacterium]|nr:bifunctional nuclease family protein [bacterium]